MAFYYLNRKDTSRGFLYIAMLYILCFHTAHASNADFYSPECHSHTYEISIKSFSTIWLMFNFIVLFCSFGVFLKFWCYKAFANETVKGY